MTPEQPSRGSTPTLSQPDPHTTHPGTDPSTYRSALPVSTTTIHWLTELIRTHRAQIRSRWRKATPGRQAVLVLAMLRKDERLHDLAGPNQVSTATMRRWMLETIELLAHHAPRLDRTLRHLAASGATAVLVDGTLLRTRRRTGSHNRPHYSGKHKHHGLNTQALTDESGRLLWISPVLPGKTSDILAARRHHLRERLHQHGLTPVGDKGFQGWHKDVRDTPDCPVCAGHCRQVVLTPYKAEYKHPLTDAQKRANTVFNGMRCAVEGGFAALKTWRILDKLRLHPRHATTLLRALLVLVQHEHGWRP